MAAIAICNQNCFGPGEVMWDVDVDSDGVPRYCNGTQAHDAMVVNASLDEAKRFYYAALSASDALSCFYTVAAVTIMQNATIPVMVQ